MNYDLVIGFDVLNQAASDINTLQPTIDRLSNALKAEGRGQVELVPGLLNADNRDLGPGTSLHRILGWWYQQWATPMSNAMSGLKGLGALFKGVADAFAESDAAQASAINVGELMTQIMRYPHLMDQYTAALNYKGKENPYTHQFPNMPDPVMPTPVSDPYRFEGNAKSDGPTTTFTYQAGYDNLVPADQKASSWPLRLLASETTTVTTGGMTFSETTTFGPDKGWGTGVGAPSGPTQDTTTIVSNIDGSTDLVSTSINPNGGGGTMYGASSSSGMTISVRGSWNDPWWKLSTASSAPGSAPPDFVPTNY